VSRGPNRRCLLTNRPMGQLDVFGPEWVTDDGLRPKRVPPGYVAMPVSSASHLAGWANQSEGAKALRADPRWHPLEVYSTSSGSACVVQRGYEEPPRGASFTGLIFDVPSSLSWLGDRLHEESRKRMLKGRKT
jgi:hypothetical protein